MAVLKEMEIRTLVVGTGAAGYAAALRLNQCGEQDLAILSENVKAGTSRNTGSDKQTYYKLSLAGDEADSIGSMAADLFCGQCVDGDLALCEAALSVRCFYHLMELGVPFPDNEYGEAIGYKTDHDRGRRASSVGPYTSKIMTECLEREVKTRQICILDQMQMIKLLVKDEKVYGVLCLKKEKAACCEFVIIWCENVVLATGGPAGMYHDSVYPASQLGSSGMAFEAGVKGKNLTEWQFGMASLNPRWNVSGTYMQVLPRMISTDQEGNDEREFLMDYFENPRSVQFLTFLKGYQWPFDSNKIYGGSSMIDLLVYQETILKGRRVFLDFMRNPGGEKVAFEKLPKEAYEYLHSAGACFGTPIERLLHMNEPAAAFYREHGVDLKKERLEIAVCVQHNNGGLSTDAHWQTNIEGVFAVGEVCGSHGVTRPGGTALNAGQVGALRVAEYIAYVRNRTHGKEANEKSADNGGNTRQNTARGFCRKEEPREFSREEGREFCREEARKRMELISLSDRSNLGGAWKKAARRMSRAAGMIRSEETLSQALDEVTEELKHFERDIYISDFSQAGMLFHFLDMLIAQKVYLSAMLDYVRHGGGSRGSALYTCPDGKKPGEKMPDLYRCKLDEGKLGGEVQEICLSFDGSKESSREGGFCEDFCECQTSWRPVRPIPEPDYFFETQWKAFRIRRGEEQ